MPVSKKPRSKSRPQNLDEDRRRRTAVPDRRAMESFLAALSGHRGDDATAESTGRDVRRMGANHLPFPDCARP